MKKKAQRAIIVLILISILFGCDKKKQDDYFARVNEKFITKAEFERRLKFFTRTTGIRDNLHTREIMLDQMINENLLIQDFFDKKLDKSIEFLHKSESIRSQFYLDELRKKMFFDTLHVSEKELVQRFKLYNQKISARHLYAATEGEADELYQRLQQGESFDELAKFVFQDSILANNGGYLGYFGKGEMDPAFERTAYSMKVGEISRPIKTQFGYSIIKIEDRIQIPFSNETEFIAARPALTTEIKKDKSLRLAQQYGKSLARDLNAKFDEKTVGFLFSKIHSSGDQSQLKVEEEKIFDQNITSPVKKNLLVSFRGGQWSAADFLDRTAFTSLRQQRRIKNEHDLKQFITGLIAREKLLQQAQQCGLDNDKFLRTEIEYNINGYIVSLMTKMITDTATVPKEAAQQLFDKNAKDYISPTEANVREILLADIESGKKILQRLKNGESFAELSKKYSLREWAADRGGELGFAQKYKYGALADTIFALQPGEILGPLKIENYFSIIQMLEKKPERQKSFEEARFQIEAELLWKWRKIRLHNYVAQLKDHAKIDIKADKLRWQVFNLK